MTELMNRRDLLKLAGVGVAVYVSGTRIHAGASLQMKEEAFYFVQLSDTHWGFDGPNINPDSQGTLKKAVAAVNALDEQPDFVIRKKAQIPWDPAEPYKGLGFRNLQAQVAQARYQIEELPISRG